MSAKCRRQSKRRKGFFLVPLTSKYNKLRSCCSRAFPEQNATTSRWQQKDNDDGGDKFH